MLNLRTAIAKLNQTNDEILSRLNKLEEEDRENVDKGIGDNKVTEIERKLETIEKHQRTCNLVITRLPEVDVVHKVNIEIEEKKLVTKVLDKLDLVYSENIEIIGRIGTKKVNSNRPSKIKVQSISEKYEILRKSPSLRQTEEYHSTYISPDLTNEQQRNGKLLRDDMKLRTNNGEVNLWIQQGKIVVRKREGLV